MQLSDDELKLARQQLQVQIDGLSDGQQRAMAQEQLDSMSDEAIEEMVLQQREQHSQGNQPKQPQKGIFRMIVDGDVPSKKINENKDSVAVVSVRAVSKGHCLVIPKKPVGDANLMSSSVFSLAKSVAKKIVSKFGAKSTEIQTESAFGEVVINVIPVYSGNESLKSPRYEVSEEELEETWKALRVVKKPKVKKVRPVVKNQEEKVLKLTRRVP